ncbi:hypothetical protein AA102526_1795 [Asaia lannensis NBRC 102526]|nr:hypothetical protein AA102526_1795 [Asaia lannensis NBRC 102526]
MDIWLDNPLATPRAQLRAPHQRLTDHDPRRHGHQSHPSKRSPVTFQTGSKTWWRFTQLSPNACNSLNKLIY